MITAQELVAREVKYCVSRLVSALAEGIHAPESHNAQGTVLGDLAWQAVYLSAPIDDWEEAATQAGWTQTPAGWWWREPRNDDETAQADFYFLGSGPFLKENTAADCCEFDDEPAYQLEVFEHWLVSDWLADKLEAHGEKVDRYFAGLTVWARTTTGQAIYADYVMEQIAAEVSL
jgi:hypothetical protein